MVQCYMLNEAEFAAAEDKRQALALSRPEGCRYASLSDVLRPGAMWHARWHFDPARIDAPTVRARALAEIKGGRQRNYLSRFYYEDWADKRPPLCVLAPSGEEWCVDARSSNGEGWKVTLLEPMITASPSILLPKYHGFLTAGVFGPDLDAATRKKS